MGGSNVGISIGGDVSFIRAEKQFSIRYLHNFEAGYFLFLHDEFPVENVMDVGILYGWRKQVKAVSFSIAGGISIVRGIERGDFLNSCTECFFYQGYYEPVKYTTIGIPLDCHFIYHPNSWFIGYGLSGFGNLNLKKSFSGILFSLQFGDLT
ncbi:MAG: hypothetical protein HYY40_09895 [Bacteroidetes bacterium]|nr:hypothetical protein [Bacteroidota bacterium]